MSHIATVSYIHDATQYIQSQCPNVRVLGPPPVPGRVPPSPEEEILKPLLESGGVATDQLNTSHGLRTSSTEPAAFDTHHLQWT